MFYSFAQAFMVIILETNPPKSQLHIETVHVMTFYVSPVGCQSEDMTELRYMYTVVSCGPFRTRLIIVLLNNKPVDSQQQ